MGLIKKIDKALPYWLEHILIAWIIQGAIFLLTQSILLGGILGASFYFVRELWQYFVQGKTHKGRFDWWGWIAPFLGCLALILLFH